MSIKSKDEIIEYFRELIGDDLNDKNIEMLEDVSDTFDNISENNSLDWKSKYEENDEKWRKKYTERFLNIDVPDEPDEPDEPDDNTNKPKYFEDLFKTN